MKLPKQEDLHVPTLLFVVEHMLWTADSVLKLTDMGVLEDRDKEASGLIRAMAKHYSKLSAVAMEHHNEKKANTKVASPPISKPASLPRNWQTNLYKAITKTRGFGYYVNVLQAVLYGSHRGLHATAIAEILRGQPSFTHKWKNPALAINEILNSHSRGLNKRFVALGKGSYKNSDLWIDSKGKKL